MVPVEPWQPASSNTLDTLGQKPPWPVLVPPAGLCHALFQRFHLVMAKSASLRVQLGSAWKYLALVSDWAQNLGV